MLDPMCIKLVDGRPQQMFASTADGYILPCCWCDSLYTRNDIENLNLFDNNLKIENVNSIDEIVYSDTWKNFYKVITEDADNAPACCKKKCSVDNV